MFSCGVVAEDAPAAPRRVVMAKAWLNFPLAIASAIAFLVTALAVLHAPLLTAESIPDIARA